MSNQHQHGETPSCPCSTRFGVIERAKAPIRIKGSGDESLRDGFVHGALRGAGQPPCVVHAGPGSQQRFFIRFRLWSPAGASTPRRIATSCTKSRDGRMMPGVADVEEGTRPSRLAWAAARRALPVAIHAVKARLRLPPSKRTDPLIMAQAMAHGGPWMRWHESSRYEPWLLT